MHLFHHCRGVGGAGRRDRFQIMQGHGIDTGLDGFVYRRNNFLFAMGERRIMDDVSTRGGGAMLEVYRAFDNAKLRAEQLPVSCVEDRGERNRDALPGRTAQIHQARVADQRLIQPGERQSAENWRIPNASPFSRRRADAIRSKIWNAPEVSYREICPRISPPELAVV
jgi:hypothetical protein